MGHYLVLGELQLNCKNAWDIEQEQKSKNQQVLTKFFGIRVTAMESGMQH